MYDDVLKRNWYQLREDGKKEGVNLSRKQARKLAFEKRHDPVFTKKWSTERGKTRAEKKMIQFLNLVKRYIVRGDWDYRKYYFEPYKTKLKEMIRSQKDMVNNL